MIFTAFSTGLTSLLIGLVSLLPDGNRAVISSVITFSTSIRSTLATVGWLIPTDTFFQILSFVVILEGAFLTWRLFSFVINNITGGLSHL